MAPCHVGVVAVKSLRHASTEADPCISGEVADTPEKKRNKTFMSLDFRACKIL